VFRGALKAVDAGQFEASASLGLRPWTTAWRVVGPQAAAVGAPTFTNSCIQLMQNTTIASGVAVYDLLGQAQNIAVNSLDGSAVVLIAVVYVAVLVPFVRLARRLERRTTAWHGGTP
jgi:polar amino acid transport system permease protein